MAGLAALSVDVPLARWCARGNCPGDLAKLFDLAESFAHGAGIAVIVLAIYLLHPAGRWRMPRLVAMTLAAGLAANLVKLCIARARPRAFDLELSVWDTFQGWFPLTSAGSAGQSLPSAHTTTAVAFAIGLVWAYPRGRWLFPTLALLAACQRIHAQAHFLSDVCWGIGLGSFIGFGFLRGWLCPRWLERWEASIWRDSEPNDDAETEPADARRQAA